MSIESFSSSKLSGLKGLGNLHTVPKQLKYIGTNTKILLSGKTLGVVGSRKVSNYGRTVTEDLVKDAANQGVGIVSGLALGVDSIAHKAALQVKGKTIAVLPSGLKAIYPAGHRELARSIVKGGGALLSEYDDKTTPMRHSFIERNRIIAALSNALLITEAAENSGSLHTANFALELGIPVLAVPGNISSPTSRGTNNLIKSGAILITESQDVLDVLGIESIKKSQEQMELYGDNKFETTILSLISSGTNEGSELLSKSQLSVSDFQQNLTMLEIKGRIKPLGNDSWGLS